MSDAAKRRVLVTRPEADAADLAAELESRGIEAVLAPVMTVEPVAPEVDPNDETAACQAILFTSRNGVRAFAEASERRDIPVFAVGDSTARLAHDLGFSNVESASGDSADLARLITDRLKPEDGPVYHAAGETVAGELAETLENRDFTVLRRTLYRAVAADALPDTARSALADGTVRAVLLFSPRTARIFERLVGAAGLGAERAKVSAICLSSAVADALDPKAWRSTRTADEPTTASLLSAVEDSFDAGGEISEADNGVEPTGESEQNLAMPWGRAEDYESDTGAGEGAGKSNGNANSDRDGRAMTTEDDTRRDTETPDDAMSEDYPVSGSEEDAPEPKSRSTSPAMAAAVTLLAVLVVLVAGTLTWPYWRDYVPEAVLAYLPDSGDGNTEEFRRDLDAARAAQLSTERALEDARRSNGALAAAVNDLKSQLAQATAGLAELKDAANAAPKADPQVSERLSRVEEALSQALNSRSQADIQLAQSERRRAEATTKLTELLGRMEGRVAELEERLQAARDDAAAEGKSDNIALAIGQLRDAMARTDPFQSELTTLNRLAGDNKDVSAIVSPLTPVAAKGVASRAALLGRVPAVVEQAAGTLQREEGDDWMAQAASKLRGFVTVRRVDGKGDTPEARLVRAERAAKRDDLETAVAELDALKGPPKEAVSGWIAEAKKRLAVDRARADLGRVVLDTLSSGG